MLNVEIQLNVYVYISYVNCKMFKKYANDTSYKDHEMKKNAS